MGYLWCALGAGLLILAVAIALRSCGGACGGAGGRLADPSSCAWAKWDLRSQPPGQTYPPPPDAVGMTTAGALVTMPCAALDQSGVNWFFGYIHYDTSKKIWSDFYGRVADGRGGAGGGPTGVISWATPQVYYLKTSCGTPVKGGDPAKTVVYQGIPVCWTFPAAGQLSAFSPFTDNGSCLSWSAVKTNPLPPPSLPLTF
jgi:hypothetical protein